MKYYVIGVWGDVEPELHGPFRSMKKRDDKARELRATDALDSGGIYRLNIDEKGKPTVDSYSGIELDPNE